MLFCEQIDHSSPPHRTLEKHVLVPSDELDTYVPVFLYSCMCVRGYVRMRLRVVAQLFVGVKATFV